MKHLAALIVALGLAGWADPAPACDNIVGWVGIPLCQADVGDPFTSVIGLDLTAADVALEADGFDTGVVVTRCSTEMADIVLSQSPVAGTPTVAGTLANLVASNGMECTIRVRGRPSFGFN